MPKDIQCENMILMFGDCLERMKEIPDGSVDMILADPMASYASDRYGVI